MPTHGASALPQRAARAVAGNQGLVFEELPYCTEAGCIPAGALARYDGQDITALVIQQPNFFGRLEDVDALCDWAHARNILVVAVVEPDRARAPEAAGCMGRAKAPTSRSAKASRSACRCPRADPTSAS